MEEKLEELPSNEKYAKELVALCTPAKIRESLLAHDVDISEKDIETVISLLKKKANGELTNEELNEIAGGFLTIVALAVSTGLVVGAIAVAESC